MKKTPLFISIFSVLIFCILFVGIVFLYQKSADTQRIAIPILNKQTGGVGVAWTKDSEIGLFASMVHDVLNSDTLQIRFFSLDEGPDFPIGPTQPDDMISFTCSGGTSIQASDVFSGFAHGGDVWLWGPYVGDESERIANWIAAGSPAQHDDHPENVFSEAKFGGRVGGGLYDYISSGYQLTDGMYVSSAMVQPGEMMYARCSRVVFCGDHWLDSPEEDCESGGVHTADCDADCTSVECGDGTWNDVAEECDTVVDSPTCNAGCTIARCGDGYVNSVAGEVCDEGDGLNGTEGHCHADCLDWDPVCGNGILEDDEQCDDGNESNEDDCTNWCMETQCGDGLASEGEACDDGATCLTEGDLVVWCVPIWDSVNKILSWRKPAAGCKEGTSCEVQSGDGCAETCEEEQYFACPAEADIAEVDGEQEATLRGKCRFGVPILE